METVKPALLFGRDGQIGRALARRLSQDWTVTAVGRADIDLAQHDALRDTILRRRPAVIINAAAFTAVDQAEHEAMSAIDVNATAVGVMAEAAKSVEAVFVHFSTDYVFDGTRGTPYLESDEPNPINVYGATKAAGDLAVAENAGAHLILRTSWIYSAHGRNFFRAIAERAASGQPLRVVGDQTGAPTAAYAVADACAAMLRVLRSTHEPFPAAAYRQSGIYNVTAAGETTWHGFASDIVRGLGMSVPIEEITSAEFGAPARRPPYSVLDNAKLGETFGIALPHWRDQLAHVLTGFQELH